MNIDKRWIPHIIMGGILVLNILLFGLVYKQVVKTPDTVPIDKSRLIEENKEIMQPVIEDVEEQSHQEMTIQDILTRADKRIVIDNENANKEAFEVEEDTQEEVANE